MASVETGVRSRIRGAAETPGPPGAGGPHPSAGLLALGTGLIGLLVLLGWLVDAPTLRTFFGLSNPMVVSTATGLVLCAASLWTISREALGRRPRTMAALSAGTAAALGALKLAEYAFGWRLGLDQTFAVRSPGAFPGQMAVPTALTFVLLGTALALIDVETRKGWRPAQTLTLLAATLPALALIGRLYDVPEVQNLLARTVVMALHTSIAFLLLCAGIMRVRPRHGLMRIFTDGGQAGTLLRRLAPTAAAIVVGAGWLRLYGQRSGLYGTEFGATLFAAFTIALLIASILRTARKLYAVELERRAAQDRQRSVLESIGEGVAVTDATGRIVGANPALERLSGWRQDEVLGQAYADVFVLLDARGDPLPDDRRFLSRALDGRTVVSSRGYEVALLRRDGVRIPVSVTTAPIIGPGGHVTGAVDVIRDVAHERGVDDLKSSLISTVSHELRTPLTMIQGFSELLLARLGEEGQTRHALEQIHGSAQRLARLIGDLLSVSSIDAGRIEVRLERVPVEAVVREVADAFERERPIEVAREDGGNTVVLADRDKLHQALTNLVSNAVKYSPKGRPITMRIASRGETVEVAVEDQGIGMSDDEMRRLFEKFFRSQRPEVREASGTGLGLYITKNLVEMQGGSIGVRSRLGDGTTFSLTLPLADDSRAHHRPGETVAAVHGSES